MTLSSKLKRCTTRTTGRPSSPHKAAPTMTRCRSESHFSLSTSPEPWNLIFVVQIHRLKRDLESKMKEDEIALRKRFTEQVRAEENRFRDWEKRVGSSCRPIGSL